MPLRRWVELGAWISGAAMLALYGGSRLWAESERISGLEAFRANASAAVDGQTGPEASGPIDEVAAPIAGVSQTAPVPATSSSGAADQSLWSDQRARAFAEAVKRPGVPSGALLIPSIRLEVPVYRGATELNLNRGAAHIEGTASLGAEGNVGLAAHRDGFFRGLEALRIDAEIILEVDRRALRYRVVDISIVAPTDVHVLAPTPTPSVTLVTCYPFYFAGSAPERYIVRAELVDSNDGHAFEGDRRMSAQKPPTKGAEL